MIYRNAVIGDYESIIAMKNRVKDRIIKEKLNIWNHGYPLDSMILEDISKSYGRVVELDGEIVAYAVFHHCSCDYEPNTFKKNNLQSFGRVMVKNGYTGKQ